MATAYSNKIVNGETVRVNWTPEQNALKLKLLKRASVLKANRAACARAIKMGLDHLVKKKPDGTYVLVVGEMVNDVQTTNPLAATIRADLLDGSAITDEYRKEWVKYCMEPHDFSSVELPISYASKANKGKHLELPAGMTVKPTDEKPKRKNDRRSEKL